MNILLPKIWFFVPAKAWHTTLRHDWRDACWDHPIHGWRSRASAVAGQSPMILWTKFNECCATLFCNVLGGASAERPDRVTARSYKTWQSDSRYSAVFLLRILRSADPWMVSVPTLDDLRKILLLVVPGLISWCTLMDTFHKAAWMLCFYCWLGFNLLYDFSHHFSGASGSLSMTYFPALALKLVMSPY